MILDGRPRMEVARDLDVPESCLRRWKKNVLEELDKQSCSGEPSASDLAAENAKLRRELAAMTEQRDILKKRYASSTRWTLEVGGGRDAGQGA